MVCNRVEAREDEDGKVAKPSNTIEPFTCLNLDIDRAAIRSLDDALDAFFDKQSLEDFKIRGKSASASKQPLLQALPSVLVLHLKRFTYDQHGSHKVLRHLSFEQTLRVQRSHLTDGCAGARSKAAPAYTLVAVVARGRPLHVRRARAVGGRGHVGVVPLRRQPRAQGQGLGHDAAAGLRPLLRARPTAS